MSNKEVYTITIKPYYNSLMNNEYYRHIIEINKMPKGPLKNIVKQINKPIITLLDIAMIGNYKLVCLMLVNLMRYIL